jgi:hypothetical protein
MCRYLSLQWPVAVSGTSIYVGIFEARCELVKRVRNNAAAGKVVFTWLSSLDPDEVLRLSLIWHFEPDFLTATKKAQNTQTFLWEFCAFL